MAALDNTILRMIRILKDFIINIINVIIINVNLIATKGRLNSLIIIINIIFKYFVRKGYCRDHGQFPLRNYKIFLWR